MKNVKNLCVHDFCESCTHIMKEKGEIYQDCKYDCFSMSGGCIKKQQREFCALCGQPMDLGEDNSPSMQDVNLLRSALENPKIKVVCFTAPSIRVSLGEEFGYKVGTFVENQMVSALKKLGFDEVFDMNLGADFTIVEEAKELERRLECGEGLPMFTSCCPGWVNFCTKVTKEFIPNLSTCKSPQQMFGSIINNYYVEKKGLTSTDIFVASIVPCPVKKIEARNELINSNVGFDVDVAITTKEIAYLLKEKNIDLKEFDQSKETYDSFFGAASGGGAIFANTGGVMESILRVVGDSLSKEELKELTYEPVRGLEGIKRAEIQFGNQTLRVAVVMGLRFVKDILNEIKNDPQRYHFIEVMACEGGCIGGAGQPETKEGDIRETLQKRAKCLYSAELKHKYRKSHKNPAVLKVYNEYFGSVGGQKAEKLLHRKFS